MKLLKISSYFPIIFNMCWVSGPVLWSQHLGSIDRQNRVQNHTWLDSEFGASLEYITSCLQKQNTEKEKVIKMFSENLT